MKFSNDEDLKLIALIQNDIVKYLNACQFASWNNLKKNIYNLNVYYSGGESLPVDNIEYKVLFPLLRTGVIEVARRPENNKLVYCLGLKIIISTVKNKYIVVNPNSNEYKIIDDIDKSSNIISNQDSLRLLKSVPSLYEIIINWKISETKVHYIYDRFNKNHYRFTRDVNCPNIYTNRDKIYSNKYLMAENGNLYMIPEIEDNVDGVNIALCYLETINRRSHFKYDKSKNVLSCLTYHTILPFILCRAFILCDPMILIDDRAYENGCIQINNITDGHVKELKRIFGEKSLEEKE